MRNASRMTALELAIVDFNRRTLLNINNDIDSNEAREVAIALLRAGRMKLNAYGYPDAPLELVAMTPAFERWVKAISDTLAWIDDDDLTTAERKIKRLVSGATVAASSTTSSTNRIERVIQNKRSTAMLIVLRTADGYDVRRFYAGDAKAQTYRLRLFKFSERDEHDDLSRLSGPWTRVLRRRAIEYAIERSVDV